MYIYNELDRCDRHASGTHIDGQSFKRHYRQEGEKTHVLIVVEAEPVDKIEYANILRMCVECTHIEISILCVFNKLIQ